MPIFVSKRGLERLRAAQEDRRFAASRIYDEIGNDGTSIYKDASNSQLASQIVGALVANGVGIAYGSEILIEDTKEYLEFDGVTVIRGSTVLLQYPDGEKYPYTILGSNEGGAGNGIISCDCDFASVLLGKKKGEPFVYKGENITILSVERI